MFQPCISNVPVGTGTSYQLTESDPRRIRTFTSNFFFEFVPKSQNFQRAQSGTIYIKVPFI